MQIKLKKYLDLILNMKQFCASSRSSVTKLIRNGINEINSKLKLENMYCYKWKKILERGNYQ